MEAIGETSIQTQEKDNTTTTTTTTTIPTTNTVPTTTNSINKKKKRNTLLPIETIILNVKNNTGNDISLNTTRGQKRAKETYDYLFGNIINSKQDIQSLFGYEFVGPTEKELAVYFKQFPKQSALAITTQDLTNYLNNNYTIDQLNKITPPISVDAIIKSADLNESGSIEVDDFVDYIQEKIIEESKSLGLIVEIDSDDEKPKKRVRKSVALVVKKQPKAIEKVSKKKKATTKKETATTKTKKVSKKETATTKTKKVAKSPKTVAKKSNLKYNFEKNSIGINNNSNNNNNNNSTTSTELNNQLEGTNMGGEGKSVPKWQYKFSNNWMDYTQAASAITEQAYQDWLLNSFVDVRSVQSGQWCYQIDFKQMTQTNIQHHDHTTRNIRRIIQNV
ncbi:hypothetical protein ACTFIU_010584 [Dictyostelium citrinum]